jgi:hypothetical protein
MANNETPVDSTSKWPVPDKSLPALQPPHDYPPCLGHYIKSCELSTETYPHGFCWFKCVHNIGKFFFVTTNKKILDKPLLANPRVRDEVAAQIRKGLEEAFRDKPRPANGKPIFLPAVNSRVSYKATSVVLKLGLTMPDLTHTIAVAQQSHVKETLDLILKKGFDLRRVDLEDFTDPELRGHPIPAIEWGEARNRGGRRPKNTEGLTANNEQANDEAEADLEEQKIESTEPQAMVVQRISTPTSDTGTTKRSVLQSPLPVKPRSVIKESPASPVRIKGGSKARALSTPKPITSSKSKGSSSSFKSKRRAVVEPEPQSDSDPEHDNQQDDDDASSGSDQSSEESRSSTDEEEVVLIADEGRTRRDDRAKMRQVDPPTHAVDEKVSSDQEDVTSLSRHIRGVKTFCKEFGKDLRSAQRHLNEQGKALWVMDREHRKSMTDMVRELSRLESQIRALGARDVQHQQPVRRSQGTEYSQGGQHKRR